MAASDKAVMLGPWGRTFTGEFWKSELPDFSAKHTVIRIGYGDHFINYIIMEPIESGPGVVGNEARVPLGPDEFIKEYSFGFSEKDAKCLSWIKLVSNKNKPYGPFGEVTTSKFSFTVTEGKPVGFFGWNKEPISSFGVMLAAPSDDKGVQVGPWGPIKGPKWEHGLSKSEVLADQPTQIVISSRGLIDQINVEPADPSPGDFRDSGCDTTKILIGTDELIKDYFVYVKPDSKALSALTFSTNKDMKGTYGTVTTSVFPLPVTKGKLVGFFGYDVAPIYSIGIKLVP